MPPPYPASFPIPSGPYPFPPPSADHNPLTYPGGPPPGFGPFGPLGPGDGPSLDPRLYLGILLHRKWLLIFSLLLALIVGLILTIRETPIYRATAVIESRPPVANPYGYTDYTAYASNQNFMGDQIQLLKSAALAQRVAKDNQVEMPLSKPEVQDAKGFFAEMAEQVETWLGKGPAAPSEEATDQRLSPVADPQAAQQQAIEAAVRGRMEVKPVPQTNLINIAIDDPDPRRAAALANAVAKTYVVMNRERRSLSSDTTQNFYDTQVRETRAELEDLERKLIAYARGKDLVSLDNLLEYHEKEFTELKSQLFEAEQRLYQAEAKYTAMRDAGATGGEDFLNNEVIQQLKTRRGQLEDEYQLNNKVFLPEYPKMAQLRTQIEAIDRQIADESRSIAQSIEIAYEAARREKDSLAQRLAESRTALLDIRDQTADYNALKREHTALLSVYDGLMTRIKETGIIADVGANNVAILDLAAVPTQPYTPNLRENLLRALVAGLVIGLLLIVLVEKMDDSVKTTEEAERLLGVPLLGGFPYLGGGHASDEKDALEMAVLSDPKSPLAEAARSLRTTLFFAAAGGTPKVLHVTSASPGEGKSVASFTTALAFARGGATVLCIDADLRNPSLHRIFDLPNRQGLSTFLVTDIQPAEITQTTDHPGLFVLPSGPLPPNPVELLSSPKMIDLIKLAAQRFDYVFIDGPPMLGLADAPVLASVAGATLFIVEPGKTRKAALLDSAKRLRGSQARVIGTVFQKMGRAGAGYGYGYGYGYHYNYQYLYGYGQPGRELERT